MNVLPILQNVLPLSMCVLHFQNKNWGTNLQEEQKFIYRVRKEYVWLE